MRLSADDEFGLFFRAIPIVVGVAAVAYFITRPDPPSVPANHVVFGCYVTGNAPPIALDVGGMRIRQRDFPIIPFHMERQKRGIVLTADAPIRADKTVGGYRYAMNSRGIGRYLPFYRVQNGRTYGVFDDALLENFQMLASDGAYLNYQPAGTERCASL